MKEKPTYKEAPSLPRGKKRNLCGESLPASLGEKEKPLRREPPASLKEERNLCEERLPASLINVKRRPRA